jgi:DNA polymerase-3 subunit beta
MNLTCSQTELAAALQLVSRAVSARPSHPVLANVLLAADKATGCLSLTGFDLSLGIQTTIPAAVEQSGAITLPARLLSDIASRLTEGVPLTLAATGETVTITSLSGSYELQGLPADDYPDLPLEQSGAPVTIDAGALLQGLRSTLFASSTDESKQLLTGVHLKLDDSGLECAATDGHRLAVLTLDHDASDDHFALTIPARSLKELDRLIGHDQGVQLELHTGKGQAVLSSADRILTTRILEGTYPAYRSLLPSGFQRSIVVDRRALMAALERVSVLADSHTNVVKLLADPDADQVTIRADAQDLGKASETLKAAITGGEITIAFNVRYLLDGLKAMACGQVVLQCNAPTTPVVLEPVGDDEGFTYLVMPVQVRA